MLPFQEFLPAVSTFCRSYCGAVYTAMRRWCPYDSALACKLPVSCRLWVIASFPLFHHELSSLAVSPCPVPLFHGRLSCAWCALRSAY